MADPELLLRAMADTTRRRILRVLSNQELSVSEVVEVLEQPQSTISRHLKVLREAGLVIDRRKGSAVLSLAIPASPAVRNGAGELRGRLLEWLESTPMDEEIHARLRRAMDRRRSGECGFLEAVGTRWDQLRIDAFGETFHLEAMIALLPDNWLVADIGTGTGYLLPTLSKQFSEVIAVEPLEPMLSAARQRCTAEATSNVTLKAGSLDALPIQDDTVDLAIASLVLHHVAEPTQAVKELHRIIRPGGRLLIIEQESHGNETFRDRMGDRWAGFVPSALLEWAESAGFTRMQSRPLRAVRSTNGHREQVPTLFAITGAKPQRAA